MQAAHAKIAGRAVGAYAAIPAIGPALSRVLGNNGIWLQMEGNRHAVTAPMVARLSS
jgi:hypothetical protein